MHDYVLKVRSPSIIHLCVKCCGISYHYRCLSWLNKMPTSGAAWWWPLQSCFILIEYLCPYTLARACNVRELRFITTMAPFLSHCKYLSRTIQNLKRKEISVATLTRLRLLVSFKRIKKVKREHFDCSQVIFVTTICSSSWLSSPS